MSRLHFFCFWPSVVYSVVGLLRCSSSHAMPSKVWRLTGMQRYYRHTGPGPRGPGGDFSPRFQRKQQHHHHHHQWLAAACTLPPPGAPYCPQDPSPHPSPGFVPCRGPHTGISHPIHRKENLFLALGGVETSQPCHVDCVAPERDSIYTHYAIGSTPAVHLVTSVPTNCCPDACAASDSPAPPPTPQDRPHTQSFLSFFDS